MGPTSMARPACPAGPRHVVGLHLTGRRTSTASSRRLQRLPAAVMASPPGEAVVVGAGPAGLTSALMLAKRGWKKITILEAREEIQGYDPLLGFVFSIDERGQQALREIEPSILENVQAAAGAYGGEVDVSAFQPDGEVKKATFKFPGANFWIARHMLNGMAQDMVTKVGHENINLRCGAKCTGLAVEDGQLALTVKQEPGGVTEVLKPSLIIASDGINSSVRKALETLEPDSFGVEVMECSSGELLYKVLSLPVGFELPGGKTYPLENDKENIVPVAAVAGALKGRDTELRLGLLPVSKGQDVCPANIIRVPNHKIWKMKDGEELLDFLAKSFPQLDIQKIVTLEEAERFVQAKPGKFPQPQHSKRLQKVVEGKDGSSSGVVIVGDAAHSFPPDLGQGVNAALKDVASLGQALDATGNDVSRALPRYEEERLPEAKAITRLVQIGNPWQYKQSVFRTALWSANVALRLIMNKILPQFFSKQVFLIMPDPELSYTQILDMANRTTRNLYILLALVVAVAMAVYRLLGGA